MAAAPTPAAEMADGRQSAAPRSPRGIWHALLWSMQGLRAAWLVESSFRLEVYLFAVLAPLGLVLAEGAIERVLLVGSLLLVIGVAGFWLRPAHPAPRNSPA